MGAYRKASSITAGGVALTTTPTGTSPPAITITGTLTDKTLKSVWVRCLDTGGARGTWEVSYSINEGVTWSADEVSAATIAVGSTGLTLNIATGSATVGNSWKFEYLAAGISTELDLTSGAPLGAVSVRVTGTYVAPDLVAEGDIAGDGYWTLLQFEPIPSGSAVDHITPTAGIGVAYVIPRKGVQKIRVRNLKLTSGSVDIALCASTGEA